MAQGRIQAGRSKCAGQVSDRRVHRDDEIKDADDRRRLREVGELRAEVHEVQPGRRRQRLGAGRALLEAVESHAADRPERCQRCQRGRALVVLPMIRAATPRPARPAAPALTRQPGRPTCQRARHARTRSGSACRYGTAAGIVSTVVPKRRGKSGARPCSPAAAAARRARRTHDAVERPSSGAISERQRSTTLPPRRCHQRHVARELDRVAVTLLGLQEDGAAVERRAVPAWAHRRPAAPRPTPTSAGARRTPASLRGTGRPAAAGRPARSGSAHARGPAPDRPGASPRRHRGRAGPAASGRAPGAPQSSSARASAPAGGSALGLGQQPDLPLRRPQVELEQRLPRHQAPPPARSAPAHRRARRSSRRTSPSRCSASGSSGWTASTAS